MSLIRPNHKMRYVKGMSSGYVFVSADTGDRSGVTDWGCSNAELVEILSGILYSITGKKEDEYNGRSLWREETDWLIHKLSERLKVSLESKILDWDDSMKLEEKYHNIQSWRSFVKLSAKDDWEIYEESKNNWGNWDFITEGYNSFDDYLEKNMKSRQLAREFVEKHYNDWKSIQVPVFPGWGEKNNV